MDPIEPAIDTVVESPYAGVRPPPAFAPSAYYFYAMWYRALFNQVDDKISAANTNSNGKLENQRKLGEALSIVRRIDDVLANSDSNTLSSIKDPRTTELRIEMMKLNQLLEDLRYLGPNRDPATTRVFTAQDSGAIASPPLTETQLAAIESELWQSPDFQGAFVPATFSSFTTPGVQQPNLTTILNQLATANPGTYGSLNAQYREMIAAGKNWETKSSSSFWTQVQAALTKEKGYLITNGGETPPIYAIDKYVGEARNKKVVEIMKRDGHFVEYGGGLNAKGTEVRYAVNILTGESNIFSQRTQQAVQEFQQAISKQANYMSAITKILEDAQQLMRKSMA